MKAEVISDRAVSSFHEDDVAFFLPYIELKNLFLDGQKEAFSARYAQYYRMNSAGLTDDWRGRYFELLYQMTPVDSASPYRDILLDLKEYPRRKGDWVLQFSFVSKLVSFIDESYPLYDKHVSNVTGFSIPDIEDESMRIDVFTENMMLLKQLYHDLSSDAKVADVLRRMAEVSPDVSGVHVNRLIDFLVWNLGRKMQDRGTNSKATLWSWRETNVSESDEHLEITYGNINNKETPFPVARIGKAVGRTFSVEWLLNENFRAGKNRKGVPKEHNLFPC